jgi:hypothetical protein
MQGINDDVQAGQMTCMWEMTACMRNYHMKGGSAGFHHRKLMEIGSMDSPFSNLNWVGRIYGSTKSPRLENFFPFFSPTKLHCNCWKL